MTDIIVSLTHQKVATLPDDNNPNHVQSSDFNKPHKMNLEAFLDAVGFPIIAGDPNGTTPTRAGAVGTDRTNGQLWQHLGGTSWVPFVRADGGTTSPRNVIVFLGNSQWCSMGASTDNMSRQPNVLVPNPNCTMDKIFGPSSAEPVPLTDMGRGPLRIANVSSLPGFGPEISFGKEIYDLLNGFGATPTPLNMPWLISFAISGMELKQMLKTSTYGTATPAFSGLNAYGAFVARVKAALATVGRKIGILVSDLGPNDGAILVDANAVAANWVTLWGQLQGDLGTDFPLLLANMHPNADSAFRPSIVRAQISLAASQIPGCGLVEYGDLPLNSDSLHLGSRRIYTLGGRLASKASDMMGLVRRKSSIVAVRGYGEPEYEGTTQKPAAYPLTQDGDVLLYMVGTMKNSGTYVAIPTPTVPASGWVQLGNETQTYGGQTQGAALFMRLVSQTDIDTNPNSRIPPGAQILLSNDENYGKLFTLFGPSRFPPIDGTITPFVTTPFSNGPFTVAGVTTTAPNSLVVICFISQGGSPAVTEHITITNANLANLTIVSDEPYGLTTGNFGVLVFAVGTKVSPGPTGNTTITPSASVNLAPCGFTVAFKAA